MLARLLQPAEQCCGDDHDAVDEHLPERRDADERQQVLEHAEKQTTDDDPQRAAGAAGDRNATDQACGDHLQLEAERDVRVSNRKARHPQVTAQTGQRTAQRERAEPRPTRVDARVCRGGLVAAHRIDIPAEVRVAQHDETRARKRDGEPGEARQAEQLGAHEAEERRGHFVVVHPRALGEQKDGAAVHGHRAERHDDGGHPQFPHEQPVERPEQRAAEDGSGNDGRHRELRIAATQQRGDHAAQCEIRRDRQIDRACHDHQHLAQRQDDQDRRVVEHVGGIGGRGEAGEREGSGDCEDERQPGEPQIAPGCGTQPPRARGERHCAP